MRHGIRDFLLVASVVVGGLGIGSTLIAADDPQGVAAAEQPASDPPASETAPAAKAGEAVGAAAPAVEDDDESPPTGPKASEEAGSEAPAAPQGAQSDGEDESPSKAVDPNHATGDKHAAGDNHAAGDGHTADDGHAGGDGHEDGHDGDDGHHDPYDLTHVNATAAIADPSEFKPQLAVGTLVVFLCLLALLGKFAWGPIMEGLERREASIAAAIDEAEQAAAKGAEQLKLYEAKLAAAADETREMMAQARRDAEATGERIIAEAQEAASRERDKAVADIAAAKNSALSEITERSVDLAVSMAGRMIHRQLTPDDRAGLIREALDQLPNQN